MNAKPFSDYTQAEKVKFLNTYREALNKKLNRHISDFDLIEHVGGEEFLECLIPEPMEIRKEV
jgi:hypothetical protein